MAKNENTWTFDYPMWAMLFLGIIIGIVFMISVSHSAEKNLTGGMADAIKDIIKVECSADIKTKQIILDDTNWFRTLDWIKYNCSGNVSITEHPDALYFSTSAYVGDSGNLGLCTVEYIDVKKILKYNG